ncbi:MAG TPA: hypothetical protein VFQ44_08820 [Streptosporangiaceae bacterium]|nr:hypothetical protein [Streptosporangiaceae bacterium]
MRSAEELRERWLGMMAGLVARPEMFATTGVEMESVADRLVADLCFLDDRDGERSAMREDLLDRYGKLGVSGPFSTLFGLWQCQAEVAAIYAEVFWRLGYLRMDETLSPVRWGELIRSLQSSFAGQDVRCSEVEERCGAASLTVGKRILCYVSARPADGWIFVECQRQSLWRYAPGTGRNESVFDRDPLVRSVRRSTGGFEDGLILTLYGEFLRWDDDAWFDHPSDKWTAETHAIAAQLRQIRDADPSQQPRLDRHAP